MFHLLGRASSPLKAALRSFSARGPPPPAPPLPPTCRRTCQFQLVGCKPCKSPSAWIVFMNRSHLQLSTGYTEPILLAFNLKGVYEGLTKVEKISIDNSWWKRRPVLSKGDIQNYASKIDYYCRPSGSLRDSFEVIAHNWDKHAQGFPNLVFNFYLGRLMYYADEYCHPNSHYYLGQITRGRKKMTALEVYQEGHRVLKRGIRVYALWKLVNGRKVYYLDGIHFLETCIGTKNNVSPKNAFTCARWEILDV